MLGVAVGLLFALLLVWVWWEFCLLIRLVCVFWYVLLMLCFAIGLLVGSIKLVIYFVLLVLGCLGLV